MQSAPYSRQPGAPSLVGPGGPSGSPAGGGAAWDVGDLFAEGWRVYKANWLVLTLAPTIAFTVSSLPAVVLFFLLRENVSLLVTVGSFGAFVSSCLLGFFYAGLTKIALAASRGQRPGLGLLFSGGNVAIPFVLAWLIAGVAIELGMVLLIIPGLLVFAGLALTPYYVVEQRLGPLEAMRASWDVTQGHRAKIVVFSVAAAFTTALGSIALGVGSVVASAIALIGFTTMYLRLTGAHPQPTVAAGSSHAHLPTMPPGHGPPPPSLGGYGR